MRPQTIQIFLTEGSPLGIKEAVITNRLVKAVMFPRNKIKEVAKREAVYFTGVYFLFGKTEKGAKPKIYVGQGEKCFERISEHNRTKDWWSHCIVFTTKTNEFTASEAKYLEHYSLDKVKEGGRYHLDNGTGSNMPSIPESREHDLLDNFETISLLAATLGFPIIVEQEEKTGSESTSDRFFIDRKGYKATSKYTNEGIVILKGSGARIKESQSCPISVVDLRQQLLEDGILEISDNKYVFTEDYIVGAPSRASDLIMGNSANGWDQWKNSDGVSLNDIVRK